MVVRLQPKLSLMGRMSTPRLVWPAPEEIPPVMQEARTTTQPKKKRGVLRGAEEAGAAAAWLFNAAPAQFYNPA